MVSFYFRGGEWQSPDTWVKEKGVKKVVEKNDEAEFDDLEPGEFEDLEFPDKDDDKIKCLEQCLRDFKSIESEILPEGHMFAIWTTVSHTMGWIEEILKKEKEG